MKKFFSIVLCVILVLTIVTGCASSNEPAPPTSGQNTAEPVKDVEEFKLKRDVEFVVPYAAGGGSDLYARIAADVIQKNGWANESLMVVNKPGGAGAVGDAYTSSKKGDNETLTTYVSGQITGQLMNNTPVTFRDLTPICNLAMDEYTFGVLSSSPYKTIDELIEAAKKSPGTITVGGSGKGTEDELVTGLLEKVAGIDLQYISYNSSGEVLSAMLGGHINAGIYNPNEIISQVEVGEAILLAAFGPERISMLPDVKTFKEQGYDEVVFQQFRGIAGPPGMSEEAVKYWSDTFKKVTETDRWKTEYLAANGLTSRFIATEEYTEFLNAEELKYTDILKSIGAIK